MKPGEPYSADVSAEAGAHVIVCGLRGLGVSIVEQLRLSGVEVTVVDDDPDRRLIPLLESWSVPFVAGSPRSREVLTRAGALQCAAVIVVERDDLRTLETALVARALRPDIRVVVQMANAAVARALTGVTGAGSALDVADLASPALVQDCLGRRRYDVSLAGERFVAAEVTVEEAGTLRQRYGDLVPIAVVPSGRSSVEICPGRDMPVGPGDRVTLLGTPFQLEELAGAPPAPPGPATPGRLRRRLAPLMAALWSRSALAFRVTFGVLAGLVVTSTVVIHLAYHAAHGRGLSLLTALYFSVETVATVGFGDFSFAYQPAWMRMFGIALIVLGAGLVTTLFALLTNFLVSRSLADALGTTRAERMTGHVVVVGLGAIGVRVSETLLHLGQPVVVIERDEDNRHLAQARALHVPIVIGDATIPATLDEANVRAASAIAVLTSNDLTNLETALSLRDYLEHAGVAPPVVMRVFDRSLAKTVEDNFGLNHVHSTSALAAPWFVGAALGMDILLTFAVEQERLLVARLTVAGQGGLAGLAMQDLSARIRVIAIKRASGGKLEHPPRRNTRFAPGDAAYLIGPYEDLLAVLRRDAEPVGTGHTTVS